MPLLQSGRSRCSLRFDSSEIVLYFLNDLQNFLYFNQYNFFCLAISKYLNKLSICFNINIRIQYRMLTKAQFLELYQQTVKQVRKIKTSNDHLNKNMGIGNDVYLIQILQQENEDLQQQLFQVDENVKRLQKSYLDPDTARKVSTLKQQYKVQKDRRIGISDSIKNLSSKHDKIQSMKPMTNLKNSSIIPTKYKIIEQNGDKYSLSTQKTRVSQQAKQNYDIQIQGYDLQNKLLASKAKALAEMQKSMHMIKHITNQTLVMAIEQGQNLDIISDNIQCSFENVKKGAQQLKDAQISQKKSRKKYYFASLIIIIFAVIAIILAVM